jgi:hypothetical protein
MASSLRSEEVAPKLTLHDEQNYPPAVASRCLPTPAVRAYCSMTAIDGGEREILRTSGALVEVKNAVAEKSHRLSDFCLFATVCSALAAAFAEVDANPARGPIPQRCFALTSHLAASAAGKAEGEFLPLLPKGRRSGKDDRLRDQRPVSSRSNQ